MENNFTEVFNTMKDLEDAQQVFINNAKSMAINNPRYNVFYKTDVRIGVDENGKEVPEMTCTLKISKKDEVVRHHVHE